MQRPLHSMQMINKKCKRLTPIFNGLPKLKIQITEMALLTYTGSAPSFSGCVCTPHKMTCTRSERPKACTRPCSRDTFFYYLHTSQPASHRNTTNDEITPQTHNAQHGRISTMAALARAAPCPRLFLRTSSSKTPSPTTTSPPPRRNRAFDAQMMRCYMSCYAASTVCLRTKPAATAAPPPQQQQRRSFRATGSVRSELAKKNHYARLQVSPTATPTEIKKCAHLFLFVRSS